MCIVQHYFDLVQYYNSMFVRDLISKIAFKSGQKSNLVPECLRNALRELKVPGEHAPSPPQQAVGLLLSQCTVTPPPSAPTIILIPVVHPLIDNRVS